MLSLVLVIAAVIVAFATRSTGSFVKDGPLYAWLIELAVIISLVAVVAYAYAIAETMIGVAPNPIASSGSIIDQLPGLTGGFLALIGVSHAAYLTYKAVSHSN